MAERYYATGRRKTAVARVWLMVGEGKITVNERPLDQYFVRESSRKLLLQPLEVAGHLGDLDAHITVRGGGHSGQAGAIRHGIAKALVQVQGSLRVPLKRQGFLTRDARVKERKKYGQKGARARFQFSKR